MYTPGRCPHPRYPCPHGHAHHPQGRDVSADPIWSQGPWALMRRAYLVAGAQPSSPTTAVRHHFERKHGAGGHVGQLVAAAEGALRGRRFTSSGHTGVGTDGQASSHTDTHTHTPLRRMGAWLTSSYLDTQGNTIQRSTRRHRDTYTQTHRHIHTWIYRAHGPSYSPRTHGTTPEHRKQRPMTHSDTYAQGQHNRVWVRTKAPSRRTLGRTPTP